MSQQRNELLQFRHRGFKNSVSGMIVEVFGNDAEPVATDGSTFKKLWDHDVTSSTTVVDHVEPVSGGAVTTPAAQ